MANLEIDFYKNSKMCESSNSNQCSTPCGFNRVIGHSYFGMASLLFNSYGAKTLFEPNECYLDERNLFNYFLDDYQNIFKYIINKPYLASIHYSTIIKIEPEVNVNESEIPVHHFFEEEINSRQILALLFDINRLIINLGTSVPILYKSVYDINCYENSNLKLIGVVNKIQFSNIFSYTPKKEEFSFHLVTVDEYIRIRNELKYDLKLLKNELMSDPELKVDIPKFDKMTGSQVNYGEQQNIMINGKNYPANSDFIFDEIEIIKLCYAIFVEENKINPITLDNIFGANSSKMPNITTAKQLTFLEALRCHFNCVVTNKFEVNKNVGKIVCVISFFILLLAHSQDSLTEEQNYLFINSQIRKIDTNKISNKDASVFLYNYMVESGLKIKLSNTFKRNIITGTSYQVFVALSFMVLISGLTAYGINNTLSYNQKTNKFETPFQKRQSEFAKLQKKLEAQMTKEQEELNLNPKQLKDKIVQQTAVKKSAEDADEFAAAQVKAIANGSKLPQPRQDYCQTTGTDCAPMVVDISGPEPWGEGKDYGLARDFEPQVNTLLANNGRQILLDKGYNIVVQPIQLNSLKITQNQMDLTKVQMKSSMFIDHANGKTNVFFDGLFDDSDPAAGVWAVQYKGSDGNLITAVLDGHHTRMGLAFAQNELKGKIDMPDMPINIIQIPDSKKPIELWHDIRDIPGVEYKNMSDKIVYKVPMTPETLSPDTLGVREKIEKESMIKPVKLGDITKPLRENQTILNWIVHVNLLNVPGISSNITSFFKETNLVKLSMDIIQNLYIKYINDFVWDEIKLAETSKGGKNTRKGRKSRKGGKNTRKGRKTKKGKKGRKSRKLK